MSKDNLKYISTRLVKRKSSKAFKEGAKKAMEINGYVAIAENGWVVKKFKAGYIERVKEIEHGSENQELILDWWRNLCEFLLDPIVQEKAPSLKKHDVHRSKKLDFGIYINADDIAQQLYVKGHDVPEER